MPSKRDEYVREKTLWKLEYVLEQAKKFQHSGHCCGCRECLENFLLKQIEELKREGLK